jgi:hypothetical protein
MSIGRIGHATAVLPSGEVLVTGGLNEPAGILSSAEVFTFSEVAAGNLRGNP